MDNLGLWVAMSSGGPDALRCKAQDDNVFEFANNVSFLNLLKLCKLSEQSDRDYSLFITQFLL